jgi:multicomponent Na+:H+ antiporter subunit E
MLVLNVLLALAWCAVAGSFDLANLIFGFGLGYVMLYLARGRSEQSRYFRRASQIVRFGFYTVWQILLANWNVTRAVLFTPIDQLQPGIVAIPITLESDAEITMLANLITLTPGTLSLDVSDDRRTLYVHSIAVSDRDAFIREQQDGFERAVRALFAA